MIDVGGTRVGSVLHGWLRLDGGAMFGSVPKTLWAREIAPDEDNRIVLAARSLVIEHEDRRAIVDLGCGDRWEAKLQAIYGLESLPVEVEGVTDVILTHLHFDHVGGIQSPSYAHARHHISRTNWEHAKSPGPKERASYRPIDLAALDAVDARATEDGDTIWPGVTVHQAHGHTRGLQWVKVVAGDETIAFPSDLMPTSHHLAPAFTMGYDLCAERAVDEKQRFLEDAIAGRWIVVFQHDPAIAAARLGWDDRHRPVIDEVVDL
ncbi:MAG TPA: MBL fold metallo-hydrolase [Fimbriimonadaceae bacterium]|nr:MBL fold metallo-hydrolase [Fimbriimonadaceae bacterium]